jgi:adenosylhomocysteine nucleosidase
MYLRSLIQTWLRNTATTKIREVLAEAAKDQPASTATPMPTEEPKPCHLGVVFALGIESGCFEDLLQGLVTIRANGFTLREGGLGGRRVVIILSGAGQENAARATEVLIDGHRPDRVVSAGFAGGLSPQLGRNDILIADCLASVSGTPEMPLSTSQAPQPSADVRFGKLLTADHVVRLPDERKALFEQYGALAVDMETFAVAEVCHRRQVAFSSIRVINDVADQELPRDVEYLLRQKTGAARLGAALGAVCQRPGSLKDMYRLHENALTASKRLAEFLAATFRP